MSGLEIAREALHDGAAPVPCPWGSKEPGFTGWPSIRVTAETVGQYFNGQPQNVGQLLGEPSGGLVDVDLDCTEAIRLAARFLPPTGRAYGRASKPRSHMDYRCSPIPATVRFEDPAPPP